MTTMLNIAFTVFCLDRWGVLGAAASTAGCTLIGPVLIMNVYYKKVVGIPILWLFRQAFRGILIYMVLGCVTALGATSLIGNIYVSFLVGGAIFVCISMGGYFLFGMNGQEKEKVKQLFRKKYK